MQDGQSIGGGGGRLFGGGGGGERRLRPQHPQNHQALKCPRCDSLNTKFCYYNNYNLSQPRHFCKACRRYWTKGGVLRNVPVGGGCRKTKRSKPKQQQTTSAADNTTTTTTANITTTTTTPPPEDQQRGREKLKSSNSHSSSESSSLTAANTATANTAVEGHSSGTTPSTHNSSNFNTKNSDNIPNGIGESKLFSHASDLNPNLEVGLQLENGSSDCGIFSEIGGFTGLINSNNEQLQFGFSSLMNQMGQDQPWQHQNQKMGQHRMVGVNGDEIKLQEMGGAGGGLIDDQTVQVESSRFGALDWHGTSDHGLFDLHTAVDHAYWTSQSQWTDQDHPSLYLP